MADGSAFVNAEPAPKDGNFYPPEETIPLAPDGPDGSPWLGPISDDEDPIDFEGWLRGDIAYPPYQLKKAALKRFRKRYDRIYPGLVVDLVEAKLVPREEVSPEFQQYLDQSNQPPDPR